MVRQLAQEMRPRAILIEGPSDFNERIEELYLPHRLPIAIYSYTRTESGERRGAYYPFCVYSPEWLALQTARELEIPARFIDLPWSEMGDDEDEPANRYADGELRSSDYVRALCSEMGVEDLDAAWDRLVEIEPDPAAPAIRERVFHFCSHVRELDREVRASDLRREAYMAGRIRDALEELGAPLLVVTGGYHTPALAHLLAGGADRSGVSDESGSTSLPELSPPGKGCDSPQREPAIVARGISLTPYSYERLDSLTGYQAGMPSPGFYHHVWADREAGRRGTYRRLMGDVREDLKRRNQACSTADLIAAEVTAEGLAAIRGHAEPWRTDLLDGIQGALVKDELEHGLRHPFLDSIHAVLRGGELGRLAEGVSLPPLVHDLRALLARHDLLPELREKSHPLDLTAADDLERSRILHRLRSIPIPGFDRLDGTDFAARTDLSRLWERWRVRWSPEYEAGCIEAAGYGPTLQDAADNRLRERAGSVERDAREAAAILLDGALMGLDRLSADLVGRLTRLIREDGSFFSVAGALGHLLYLYRYDETLGAAGGRETGELLAETWSRALALLERLAGPGGKERELLAGVVSLSETQERCGEALSLERGDLLDVLLRIEADPARAPVLKGAAMGSLWRLGEAPVERLVAGLRYFSDPAHLGDYLTGLFSTAREAAQREIELLTAVDTVVLEYADESFLEALPALRLAFSYFTPREKHHLARSLLETAGTDPSAELPDLEVPLEVAVRAMALEASLSGWMARCGLVLGGEEESPS